MNIEHLLSPLSGPKVWPIYFYASMVGFGNTNGSRRLRYFLCRAHQGWKIYDIKRGQINFSLLGKITFPRIFRKILNFEENFKAVHGRTDKYWVSTKLI